MNLFHFFRVQPFVFLFLSIAGFLFLPGMVAAEGRLIVEVLERKDCIHCEEEKEFLSELAARRLDVEVTFYDIDADGKDIFERVVQKERLSKATPITLVGGRIIQGFDDETTTGKYIESLLDASEEMSQMTFAQYLSDTSIKIPQTEKIAGASCKDGTLCKNPNERDPILVRVPIVGTVIDASKYSLPVLAIVLGFIDGFNPCAMWVLITFLVLLSQVGSRKKLLQVAGIFVLAEATMYFLILNVWFSTWDFIGLDRMVTPIVGLVAFGGGLFFLYEWYKSLGTEMACRIVDVERRSKIVARIKSFVSGKLTWLSILGIVGLAFTVNVIEFACSIGIPQAFTKIIEMNNSLAFFEAQSMMVIYVLFYMVDDIVVFGLAAWGFEKIHLVGKYSQWSSLIGGILMLILGYFLMFDSNILSRLN